MHNASTNTYYSEQLIQRIYSINHIFTETIKLIKSNKYYSPLSVCESFRSEAGWN